MSTKASRRDYSLLGDDARLAVENGLATAEWYQTNIPRKVMKDLMKRVDGPGLRDTAIWFLALIAAGCGIVATWNTPWVYPLIFFYGIFYATVAEARWHECGHGTAFKTRWMNDAVYHVACFILFREPTIWRWSHTRHHTDTIIVGRDPEIVATRPPNVFLMIINLIGLKSLPIVISRIVLHATGRLTEQEKTFVPESEWHKVYRVARIWCAIHLSVVVLAIAIQSWIPLVLIGLLPNIFGVWLARIFGMTQHAGLAEDVLDHRLNSRTVMMNPVFRFIYWNMNYHVEHHMFPMVPYHQLPKLHDYMKLDTPRPYSSLFDAYREIIPALLRQRKDPNWFVKRELPATARPFKPDLHGVEVIDATAMPKEEVARLREQREHIHNAYGT